MPLFRSKRFSIAVAVIMITAYSYIVSAAQLPNGTPPSTGGYLSTEFILDPGCAPGAADCYKNLAEGWNLTGNSGTTSGTNFLGTTDAQDIMFKTNNVQIGVFGQQGRIALGGNIGGGFPTATANGAIALGSGATASATNALALGVNATANETTEIMLGDKRLNLKARGFIFNQDSFDHSGTVVYVIGPTTNPVNLGSTATDVVFQGSYTGTSTTDVYSIVIEPGGATFTFKFNGTTVSTGNVIDTGVPTTLQDGIQVAFSAFSYISDETWQMIPTTTGQEEQKFFFDYTAKALRIGSVDGVQWQGASLGTRSIALGFADTLIGVHAPIASGTHSFAFGVDTQALGSFSTAFGYGTNASGSVSTTFGSQTQASGDNAVAFGSGSQASDSSSTAFGLTTVSSGIASTSFGFATNATNTAATSFGLSTNATGEGSTAFGLNTTASNYYSTAFGSGTVASGQLSTAFGDSTQATATATTAFGSNSSATGIASFAAGRYASAISYSEVALGMFNTSYVPFSQIDYNDADRLLVVGNGSSGGAFVSDALTILKNGKVGIGIDNFENTSNQIDDGSGLLQVNGKIFATDVITQNLSISSDSRLKRDIVSSPYGLDAVRALRPVTYHLISDGSSQIGFIAQEVQQLLPELVVEGKYLSLNYTGMIPVLAKAIQELDLKVTALQSLLATTSSLSGELQNMVLRVKSFVLGTSDNPTGFTLYDTVTREPYCVTLAQGEFVKTKGECGTAPVGQVEQIQTPEVESSSPTQDTPTPESEPQTPAENTTEETMASTPEVISEPQHEVQNQQPETPPVDVAPETVEN